MRDREPTMRSRELGEGLRRAMETAGLTGVEAARRLDWSPSRVSRMLSGTRGTTEVDDGMFLAVCGVSARARPAARRLPGPGRAGLVAGVR